MISPRRALLESLLTLLRDRPPAGFGLKDSECGIMSGGRPPVAAGPYFWALHGGGGVSSIRTSFEHRPSLKVTLSVRTGSTAADRLGSAIIFAEDGIDDRLHALLDFLAQHQHDWMNAANALLGPDRQGFYLPAFDVQDEAVREVGPDWWRAAPPPGGLSTPPAPPGLTVGLTVSGFLRDQYIETAT